MATADQNGAGGGRARRRVRSRRSRRRGAGRVQDVPEAVSLVISLVATSGSPSSCWRHPRGGLVAEARTGPGRRVSRSSTSRRTPSTRRAGHHHQRHPEPDRRRRGVGRHHEPPGRQRRRAVPGREGPQALIKLIGTTAQLYFRPVLCGAPAYTPPGDQGDSAAADPPSTLPACGQYAHPDQSRLPRTRTGRPDTRATTSPTRPGASPPTRHTKVDDGRTRPVLLPSRSRGRRPSSPPRYRARPLAARGHGHRQSAVRQFDTQNSRVGRELQPQARRATVGHSWRSRTSTSTWHRPRRPRGARRRSSSPPDLRSFQGKVQISGNFTQAHGQEPGPCSCNYGSLPVKPRTSSPRRPCRRRWASRR